MRIFAIGFIFMIFQSISFAQAGSPPLNSFASDELRLLPLAESDALTSQANMGVHSATKVQPFLEPQALRNYKTIFNSSAILANFPMSASEQQKLNQSINESLGKSNRVSVTALTDAQATLYSAISVKKNADASAILEVVVGVSDWPNVKQRQSEGPVPALIKSSIWVSISRQKLAWKDISADGELSFEKIEKQVIAAYRENISQVLFAL